MDEDSDEEFLGFNTDDLKNDEGTADFKEVAWKYGRAQLTISRHKKKINVEIPENAEIIEFFKL